MNTIIGIDPGTTAAYAVIDMSGNLIRIHSLRGLNIKGMIKETSELNKVIVATDRRECPKFVKKFAAATGTRIIYPERDLSSEEKKELVNKYDFNYYFKNSHEIDALSAALYALKKINPLLIKIRKFFDNEMQKRNVEEISEFYENVEKEVLLKETSIRKTIERFRNKKKEKRKESV